ncbi:MAG TPA: ABC-F family ATP-binding cassette domain-containing protein [Fimbriiglobus sp.]|jgi:ATP-binding cassette subfamily F protein uup
MTVLLSGRGLTKNYGPRPLFTGLNVEFHAGERVGLIGPNGAGKSTLLKLLAGRELADDGSVTQKRGATLAYLPQEDEFAPDRTVRQVVLDASAEDHWDEAGRETRTTIALARVGFTDTDQLAATLSGGWRKRLALARELARNPDFLLLDEPTNHLDLPGVVWLEAFLRASEIGYLVATHDRAFLRAVADDVVELSRVYPDGVFRSSGGYDDFADRKEAFLDAQDRERDAVANRVRKETEWLSRKESAQRKKSRSRIQEAADRRGQLAELNYRTAATGAVGIDFAGTGRQTKKLLTVANVSKSLGGRPLFANVDLILTPGMRLGLLGANGSGKTTLLHVLAGRLAPDTGLVTPAERLRTVLFEQGRSSLSLTTTLRRALAPNTETVLFRDRPIHVAAWAQQFHFTADQLDIELGALSGGERARVRIAQLMLQPADVLFLDEPTNDLDIPALEVLEESLADFPGAVVLVSHDRDLMDRLCTDVIGLDGRGNSQTFGSLSQWLSAVTKLVEAAAPAPKPIAAKTSPKPKKLSYKEQLQLEGMEAAILKAEREVLTCQAGVERAATAGHTILAAACMALEQAQRQVDQLYSQWQDLEARRASAS